MPVQRNGALATALVLIGIMLGGCNGVGPETISRDRFDYGMAIGDS